MVGWPSRPSRRLVTTSQGERLRDGLEARPTQSFHDDLASIARLKIKLSRNRLMTMLERDIILPDIGAGQLPMQVSSWLVEVGEYVFEGDRIVEVMVPGMTFDVPAPCNGRLFHIERFSGASVKEGEALGKLISTTDNDS